MSYLLFPLFLLVSMFCALVLEHFIPPIPQIGARILLMPMIMFYGAVALPLPGMLLLAFTGGLMWDLLHTQIVEGSMEIALGWSVVLYSVLCAVMSGLRPLFLRGRWELHCLLCGVLTGVIPLAEYLMISIRRLPVAIQFDEHIWWRIGGSALATAFMAPFMFFAFNYLARLMGYDIYENSNEDRIDAKEAGL